MKSPLALLALPVLLAACSSEEIDQPDDGVVLLDGAAAGGPTKAGAYEVLEDGEVVGSTRIDADGRYIETYPDGSQVSGQMRREANNRVCFDPDGEDPAACFSEGDVSADGSFEVVGDDGSTAIIRPVG